MQERNDDYYKEIVKRINQIAKDAIGKCYQPLNSETKEEQINQIKQEFVDKFQTLVWEMGMPIEMRCSFEYNEVYVSCEKDMPRFFSSSNYEERKEINADHLKQVYTAINKSKQSISISIESALDDMGDKLGSVFEKLEEAANDIDKTGHRAALHKQESQKEIASTLIQALGTIAMVTGVLVLAIAIIAYGSPHIHNMPTALRAPITKILDIAENKGVIALVGGAATFLGGLAANMLAEKTGNALVATWSPEVDLATRSAQDQQRLVDAVATNLSEFGAELMKAEKAIRALDDGGIAN